MELLIIPLENGVKIMVYPHTKKELRELILENK